MIIPFYTAASNNLSWEDVGGSNRKSVLVIISSSGGNNHLTFLKKVLASVKLDFESDIHFLSLSDTVNVRILAERNISRYQNLLVFGIDPERLGFPQIDTRKTALLQFEKINCLWAPTLELIEAKPELKKALWDNLRQLFSI